MISNVIVKSRHFWRTQSTESHAALVKFTKELCAVIALVQPQCIFQIPSIKIVKSNETGEDDTERRLTYAAVGIRI